MTKIKPFRAKHFCNIGDIIASLPALKRYYELTGKKVIFCQQLDVPAHYYEGAVHPTKDNNGVMVMCNQLMYDMIRPLLLAQEYIEDVEVFTGQDVNMDIDVIRKKYFVNIPHMAIQSWVFMAFPDLSADLTIPWLNVDEVDISDCYFQYSNLTTSYMPMKELNDMCVVNFTERYRNAELNYYFLKKHQSRIVFAGTLQEYQKFTDQWNLSIPRLVVKDFLQLAFILKNSRLLLSNQSFLWNCAEAMKTPRILELCQHAPNCQPFIGQLSFGYLHQTAAEYYFELLMKKI